MINQMSMQQFQALSRFFLLRLTMRLRALCATLLIALAVDASAAPGQLDPTFGTSGTVVPIDFSGNDSPVSSGALLPLANGALIVARSCLLGAASDNHYAICLKRLTSAGQVDATFGTSGLASADFPITMPFLAAYPYLYQRAIYLARQLDGKLLAAAACTDGPYFGPFCIARFDANGALDPTFNSSGAVPGTLSVYGYFAQFAGPIALQSNGKIVIAGQCSYPETMCVTRLTANGVIDTTFANAASGTARVMPFGPTDVRRVTAMPSTVTVDSSDRIVIVGRCTVVFVGSSYPCIGRLNPNGSTDTTFVNADTSAPNYGSWFGVPTFGSNASANSVAILADGKILFIGDCGNSPATWTCVTRLLPGGAPDPSFTSTNSTVPGTVKLDAPDGFKASQSLKIQSDGKIVFAGECSSIFSLFCVGRLNADGTLDTTFDESPGNGNGIVQLAIGSGAGYATDVALTAAGKIVLYGSCRTSGGTSTGCAARLLGGARDTAACALNADANTTIASSTDALLILRYLFGYRGDALTDGVLGANPTRTGQALETYLASLNLDADGDGQAYAMTDGLLILRAMLGLSGNALTAGAANTSHPSARNAQQILTWIESTHGVACLP